MTNTIPPPIALITLLLPGPTRKRVPAAYHYRVTYRNPDPAEAGCVMTWGVRGGREEYQLALEREEGGHLRWHCTCPDAVYHADHRNAHRCKHVQGLMGLFDTIGNPVGRHSAAA